MFALLVLLAAAPQDPATAPVKLRYQFSSNMEMTMDMGKMMEELRTSMGVASTEAIPTPTLPSIRATITFTLTSKDSAGGRAARLVIDTVVGGTMSSLMARYDTLPPAKRDSMKAQMKALLGDAMKSAQGESLDIFAVPGKALKVDGTALATPDMAMLTQALALLFPPMKVGTTVGQTWTDTTSADTLVASPLGGSFQPRTQTITKWKMITREAYEGEVTSTNSMNMDALGSAEGTTTGKTRIVLDKNRYVIEAGSSTSMVMNMKGDLFGSSGVAMTQSTTVSLTRVR